MEEVIASQRAMLARAGKVSADPAALSKVYQSQLSQVEQWLAEHACFETRPIEYHRILDDPLTVAEELNSFLGSGLDTAAMAGAVDRTLYRQRMDPS